MNNIQAIADSIHLKLTCLSITLKKSSLHAQKHEMNYCFISNISQKIHTTGKQKIRHELLQVFRSCRYRIANYFQNYVWPALRIDTSPAQWTNTSRQYSEIAKMINLLASVAHDSFYAWQTYYINEYGSYVDRHKSICQAIKIQKMTVL